MAKATTVYLRFKETPDTVNPDGTPQELNEIGLPMQIVRKVVVDGKSEIVDDFVGLKIRPNASEKVPHRIIPGTRIVATNSPAIVQALLDAGGYELCDPPGARRSRTSARKSAPRKRPAARKTAPPPAAAPSTPTDDTTSTPENKEQ